MWTGHISGGADLTNKLTLFHFFSFFYRNGIRLCI